MNPSKVLAMWIHLGPDQLICVFITSETDCQLDLCFLAGVISGQTTYHVKRRNRAGADAGAGARAGAGAEAGAETSSSSSS